MTACETDPTAHACEADMGGAWDAEHENDWGYQLSVWYRQQAQCRLMPNAYLRVISECKRSGIAFSPILRWGGKDRPGSRFCGHEVAFRHYCKGDPRGNRWVTEPVQCVSFEKEPYIPDVCCLYDLTHRGRTVPVQTQESHDARAASSSAPAMRALLRMKDARLCQACGMSEAPPHGRLCCHCKAPWPTAHAAEEWKPPIPGAPRKPNQP